MKDYFMSRHLLGTMGKRNLWNMRPLLTRNLESLQLKHCPTYFQLVSSDEFTMIENIVI